MVELEDVAGMIPLVLLDYRVADRLPVVNRMQLTWEFPQSRKFDR
jgi:hypothetical protein